MTYDHPFIDALFDAHRHLCRRGARKFFRRGLERSDLEQVAAIGLVKACRRYDASAGTPFEAYAWVMILGELMHHVRDLEDAVRLPRWVRSLERPHADASERLTQRLGREPADAEVAHELRVAPRVVSDLRRALASRVSEHIEVASSHGARSADPVDRVLAERALAAVEPSARAIVIGIYVLGLSRREIARRAGMTARQVARAHDAALSRMRTALF
jgi:RNA polymerase sigma-B factor